MSEIIQIRMNIEGDLARRFLFIKKKWGIEAHVEMIRLLITQEYQRLAGSL